MLQSSTISIVSGYLEEPSRYILLLFCHLSVKISEVLLEQMVKLDFSSSVRNQPAEVRSGRRTPALGPPRAAPRQLPSAAPPPRLPVGADSGCGKGPVCDEGPGVQATTRPWGSRPWPERVSPRLWNEGANSCSAGLWGLEGNHIQCSAQRLPPKASHRF